MSRRDPGKYDVIVIGAGVGGLVAAAYLGRAAKRVLVLEQQAVPPEPVGPFCALDPVVLAELKLAARGLRFVDRDLPLALPGPSGAPLVLGQGLHAAVRALSALSDADARAWPAFRRALFAQARVLRRWWWNAPEGDAPGHGFWRGGTQEDFARLSLSGADAWLGARLESDALVAALLFDACAGGFHVGEPGSALALVWRVAQQMAGRPGASAMPVPGTLVWSLIKAAAAADFRCCTPVRHILPHDGTTAAVVLAGGEVVRAPLIFSSLPRRATLALTGAELPLPEVGEARLLLTFREPLAFPPARLVLAERSEIYLSAHEAARDGRLPDEQPMELAAAAADKIAVTLRPVPACLSATDRVLLAARAVQALSRQIPGSAARLSGVRFVPPVLRERATLAHLMAPARARIVLQRNLYLCGADAEPLAAPSGRAARLAVGLALKANPWK